jgi:hypothetical protein
MPKQLRRNASKSAKQVKARNIKGIVPFTETPGENKYGEEKNQGIGASQLFSLFTADIIKEDIVFKR